MKIPQYARYEYCNKRACEFLEEFSIKSFPIDVKSIIYKSRWGLVKYSELMKRFSCNRTTVIRCLGSTDGFTTWDGYNYTISYNDYISLGERTRFTLMHEIGHIYLKHLTDFEATTIYRGSLSRQENKVLENEANAFARNVLSPASMYLTLKNKSVSNVARTFGITEAAAETRIDFINRDVELIKTLNLSHKIMLVYHRFMTKRKCNICHAQFFNTYTYCPICGSKKSLQWGDGKMIYQKLETYDNGKLKECPNCQNEETNIDGNYCHICGENLVNLCSYDNCPNSDPLPTNARYCPVCGSKSTFLEIGFLKEWNYKENDFMSIPDEIDPELPFN